MESLLQLLNKQRIVIFSDKDIEIVLWNWSKGYKTENHWHPEGGCIFKIFSGRLLEFRKDTTKILLPGDISWIDNSQGQHCIYAAENSISLHIYIKKKYDLD